MAKRKDDASFGFVSGKKKKDEPAAEAAETPADDPFATPDASAEADPFATPDASADPFATPDASAEADPFATPSADADPFATPSADADPFATPDASADPFATPDASADPFATPDASADPFATPDASADPFATPDSSSEATATEEAPAEEPAPAAAAPDKKGPPKIKEHKQFRILIMGDFSGRANKQMMQTGDDVARRKVRTIDSDSFPKVMAALKPEIQLPVSETSVVGLTFSTIEDFRPDALLAQIEAFAGMMKLRDELKNPKTFKTAAAAVRKLTGEKKPAKTAKPPAGKAAPKGAESGSDFERMLSQAVAPKNAQAATADALIANLVAGYEVPAEDPDQAHLVKLIEDAISAGLRAVLRHPAFQAVESSWRGVEFLTSRLNTDADLKICLFDISKDELYADLHTPASVDKSGIYRTIVEETKIPGVEPFAVVIGNYMFDQTPRDISLLAKIASLMHLAGIPFLAAATAKVAGFPSFGKFPDAGRWTPPADIGMWEKIRTHKAAAHIGLAAPRFLMRMPYGPKTDAVDAFAFEEMPGNVGGAGVDGYLWGNGAFAVALCMGEAFLEDGWSFQPGTDVTDLPCHMAMVDGDREMTPCAEGWLSDRVAAVLHDLGLIPLLSVRNAASVKVAGIHSIAKGGKPLAATWTKQA